MAAADGGEPAAAACRRKDRRDGAGGPALAAADGGVGLRPADRLDHAMAGERSALRGIAGPLCRTAELAAGNYARESGRVR